MFRVLSISFLLVYCFSLFGQKGSFVIQEQNFPEHIHPLHAQSPAGQSMASLLFQRLIDVNIVTGKVEPVLAEDLPFVEFIADGPNAGGMKITYTLREDARWGNGNKVAYEDVLFTYKALYNPIGKHGFPHPFFTAFRGIEQSPENPRSFTITTSHTSIQAPFHFGMWVLPRFHYDPENLLSRFSIQQLLTGGQEDSIVRSLELQKFSVTFYSEEPINLINIPGSGPYNLVEYNTDMWYGPIRFERKQNWWGDAHKNLKSFEANPHELVYKIYDWQYALKKWSEGEIDVLRGVPGRLRDSFELLAPRKSRSFEIDRHNYEFLLFNQKHPILKDSAVRQALRLCIAKSEIIEQIVDGKGKTLSGPVHPSRTYYHSSEVEKSVRKARSLLLDNGWFDGDGDDILEKRINGKMQSLTLTIYHNFLNKTREAIAKNLAFQLRSLGAEIRIKSMPWRELVEEVQKGKFEMVIMGWGSSMWEEDFIPQFHSSMQGGSNAGGMSSKRLDKLMEQSLITFDDARRHQLYVETQKVIAEICPAIYLYIPQNNIFFSKKVKGAVPFPNRMGFRPQLLSW